MNAGLIEFGVGDDRSALDELRKDHLDTADALDISLEDFLLTLVASYDAWITERLSMVSDMARQEINTISVNILLGIGVSQDALFFAEDENEVDYLVDEAESNEA